LARRVARSALRDTAVFAAPRNAGEAGRPARTRSFHAGVRPPRSVPSGAFAQFAARRSACGAASHGERSRRHPCGRASRARHWLAAGIPVPPRSCYRPFEPGARGLVSPTCGVAVRGLSRDAGRRHARAALRGFPRCEHRARAGTRLNSCSRPTGGHSMYQAPLRDLRFVLHELLDTRALENSTALPDYSAELADSILTEAGRFAEQVLEPLNQSGDREGAHWSASGVTTAKGFKEAYAKYVE